MFRPADGHRDNRNDRQNQSFVIFNGTRIRPFANSFCRGAT
ncbi:hypothetical protein RRSWK_00227 [Rhodopirellula sp. SWK7]|nr:hypothetical protein RRSWK_00227 [Rhodopirellula sp. SWK7]